MNPIGVDSIIQFGEKKYKAKIVKVPGVRRIRSNTDISLGLNAQPRTDWLIVPVDNAEYVGMYRATNQRHPDRKYQDFEEMFYVNPEFPLKHIILSGDAAQRRCDDDQGFNARMISASDDEAGQFSGDRMDCLILQKK